MKKMLSAINKGDIEKVKQLLDQGYVEPFGGMVAEALVRFRIDIAHILLDYNTSVGRDDANAAALAGDIGVLQRMQETNEFDLQFPKCLEESLENGNEAMFHYLLTNYLQTAPDNLQYFIFDYVITLKVLTLAAQHGLTSVFRRLLSIQNFQIPKICIGWASANEHAETLRFLESINYQDDTQVIAPDHFEEGEDYTNIFNS